MRLSRQFQTCLIFLQKDFASTKSTKTQNYPLMHAKKLLLLLFRVCLILFSWLIFTCDVFLCTQNLFIKKNKTTKKKTQAWNCLDNLIMLYYCSTGVKGLRVNVKKTKMMISSENARKVKIKGLYSSAACRKVLDINSILYWF